jgi:DNA/RNA-binding domain of Phe-tRNA-synthetase-like protein
MLRDIEKKTRENFDSKKVTEIPTIAKWRDVYKSFGAKPNKYRNSVEALIKRILKTELYKINPLVDLYNYISIKYLMTAGGEDLDTIDRELALDFAVGNEEFIALGSNENDSPWKGEVVYKDDKGIICRCWNYKEGDRTKLTEKTKNAVIVIENIIPKDHHKLSEALRECKALIEKYCSADCEIKMFNKENPEEEI